MGNRISDYLWKMGKADLERGVSSGFGGMALRQGSIALDVVCAMKADGVDVSKYVQHIEDERNSPTLEEEPDV